MQDLKVTIIQSDLKWQDKAVNLANFERDIIALKEHTDIVVLPEMFSTGFSMNPEQFAEPKNGETVTWMLRLAKEKNTAICGSLMINESEENTTSSYVNQFVWVEPNGTIKRYNKHHLFNLIEENKHYQQGNEHLLIDYKGWKIQPFVCYDLRFPAWCRNQFEADIQLFVANWPAKRSEHWKTLLKARAIENQCFVVAVNRIGNDNNKVYHSGDSGIYNFAGEAIISIADESKVYTTTLSLETLKNYRKRYPFLADRDKIRFE